VIFNVPHFYPKKGKSPDGIEDIILAKDVPSEILQPDNLKDKDDFATFGY
jgi:hypothetical protein